MKANPSNRLFQHEYGHYLQSQSYGYFYLSKFGIPSLFSAWGKGDHTQHPVEQDANTRAYIYFTKNEKDFEWNKEKNPINGYN